MECVGHRNVQQAYLEQLKEKRSLKSHWEPRRKGLELDDATKEEYVKLEGQWAKVRSLGFTNT